MNVFSKTSLLVLFLYNYEFYLLFFHFIWLALTLFSHSQMDTPHYNQQYFIQQYINIVTNNKREMILLYSFVLVSTILFLNKNAW